MITFSQSTASQITEALRFFYSKLVVSVFQDFTELFCSQFKEVQADAQMEGPILSVAKSEAWSMDRYCNPALCRQWNSWWKLSKLYAKHYSKNVIKTISQLLESIKFFLEILEPRRLNASEKHGAVRERNCNILQTHYDTTWIINIPYPAGSYIAVKHDWFKAVLGSDLKAVHADEIAVLSRESEKNIYIGPEVLLIRNQSDNYPKQTNILRWFGTDQSSSSPAKRFIAEFPPWQANLLTKPTRGYLGG